MKSINAKDIRYKVQHFFVLTSGTETTSILQRILGLHDFGERNSCGWRSLTPFSKTTHKNALQASLSFKSVAKILNEILYYVLLHSGLLQRQKENQDKSTLQKDITHITQAKTSQITRSFHAAPCPCFCQHFIGISLDLNFLGVRRANCLVFYPESWILPEDGTVLQFQVAFANGFTIPRNMIKFTSKGNKSGLPYLVQQFLPNCILHLLPTSPGALWCRLGQGSHQFLFWWSHSNKYSVSVGSLCYEWKFYGTKTRLAGVSLGDLGWVKQISPCEHILPFYN